jgi:thiomorpholine-carboxylate dehydrogenase
LKQLELQPAAPRHQAVRCFGEDEIRRVLHMPDLIRAMREVLIEFSAGAIAQPARRLFPTPKHGGFLGAMPAASAHALGAKVVTFFPGNAQQGIHTHNALIMLFAPETGEPLALLDGRLITEMRTAAVTAAFVDAVAAADVSSLAILGAGTQGRAHVEALAHVRAFADLRIWNRTRERAERLAADLGGRATSCEEAVRDADVVVVATASADPVIDGAWLKPGAKVASVGWRGADGAELDAVTMAHTVIVDSREGAATESGNVRRHSAHIFAELGEVLAGTKVLDPHATVVFDSIGMACEDIAAATLAYGHLAR